MNAYRPRSHQLYQAAWEKIPGGVSSPVRAFRSVKGTPIYFRRAQGSHVWDEDGKEYVDFCMSWGPLILGHAHPAVVEAVQKTAQNGLSFGACCAQEIELAELILAGFPSMEQVRFLSSGTEAVMTALRLARAATGRNKIVKFSGGYHGHSDSLLVKAGSGLATLGVSSSKGVPHCLAAETLVLPFDDQELLENTFSRWGDQIAAVIVEPLPANEGLLEQHPAWLRAVRQCTRQHGALLILDEVISGFRLRYGGYGDSLEGVDADLVTLGKIIGGGMPVAALVGSRKLMSHLAPLGEVYQAGTLSGNPVALAAGIATLRILAQNEIYTRLENLGTHLDLSLNQIRLPCLRWRRAGSIFWFYLALTTDEELPRRAENIQKKAISRFHRLHAPMLNRGWYLPPSGYEVLFLSAAHTPREIEGLIRDLGQELPLDQENE